jgi:hypothetical protein
MPIVSAQKAGHGDARLKEGASVESAADVHQPSAAADIQPVITGNYLAYTTRSNTYLHVIT